MIENYAEIIDRMTQEEAMEVVSKMGIKMTDHPYLSEERRKELKDEEQKEIEEYKNKIKNPPLWQYDNGPIGIGYKLLVKGIIFADNDYPNALTIQYNRSIM